jgi:EAL domain-containing protein (putative c-di-GMP-specific phosphodiesterase class I)
VINERAPALIRQADLLNEDKGVPMPSFCDAVFATMSVAADGNSAVIFWARSRNFGPALTILDFSLEPFAEPIFRRIAGRLAEFAALCRSHSTLGIITSNALARQAEARGIPAQGIDEFLSNPEVMAIAAATHVSAGAVKISNQAQEGARHRPLAAALDFRFGRFDGPLVLAALAGIVAAFETEAPIGKVA